MKFENVLCSVFYLTIFEGLFTLFGKLVTVVNSKTIFESIKRICFTNSGFILVLFIVLCVLFVLGKRKGIEFSKVIRNDGNTRLLIGLLLILRAVSAIMQASPTLYFSFQSLLSLLGSSKLVSNSFLMGVVLEYSLRLGLYLIVMAIGILLTVRHNKKSELSE